MDAARAAETVARTAYGRLLALVAARSRDIAAAEDALSEAFQAALRRWQQDGVPKVPEAWLLTVARRHLGHAARHAGVIAGAAAALDLLAAERAEAADDFPDARLKLLFVCAHPAIDPAVHTPLMLQTVLGLDATRIGAAFLVPPATMGQRLVRAKNKIRDAGIRFDVPEAADLPARLDAVLAAVYAAYGSAWEAQPGAVGGLADEAHYLARLLAALLPEEPEALGLLALIRYCDARAAARRDAAGRFVPLAEQETALWSRPALIEAEEALTRAARLGRFGRFQTEAAIQSFHCQRRLGAAVPLSALVALYDALMHLAPSVGAAVARAVAVGEAYGPEAGLAQLTALDPTDVASYQPFWAARAHLLRVAGDRVTARAAFAQAIALSGDPSVQAYLEDQQATCG